MSTDILNFASEAGSDIVTGLTFTAAEYDSTIVSGNLIYGKIKYTLSGSPDLSGVIALGHRVTIVDFINASNNGENMLILEVNNTEKTIYARVFERLNNSEDETGASATGKVTTGGAEVKEMSITKNARGLITGEKPGSATFNWLIRSIVQVAGGAAAKFAAVNFDWLINNSLKVGARLVEGSGATISNVGDGTQKIDVNFTEYASFEKITAVADTEIQALDSPEITHLTIDCTGFTSGKAVLTVDGVKTTLTKGSVLTRVIDAQDISIKTSDFASSVTEIGATANNHLVIPSGSSNTVIEGPVWVSDDRQILLVSADGAIRQYNNTGSGDIDDFVYAGSLTVGPGTGDVRGLSLSPDGLLLTAFTTARRAYVFQLTTAGNVLSGVTTLGDKAYSFGSSTNGDIGGTCFNDDGTKFYWFNDGRAYQTPLSTAYRPDLGTTSATSIDFGTGIRFAGGFIDDGKKFLRLSGDDLIEHAVSTAFDITTANLTPTATKTFTELSSSHDTPWGFYILGLRIYVGASFFYGDDKVYEFSIGQAFSSQILTRTGVQA